MQTVLVVDDEAPFLRGLLRGFRGLPELEGIRFLTASGGEEALRVLRSERVDLLVTDLKMPGMDGLELVARMGSDYEEVPVIVMSAFGTPELQERVSRAGAVEFVDKPVDVQDLAARIQRALAGSARGFVSGIELHDLIQVIHAGAKSCSLEVRCKAKTGWLYFFEGELVDARCPGCATPKEAAFEVLGWDAPEVRIGGNVKRRENRVKLSIQTLLMEAMYQRDERARHSQVGLELGDEVRERIESVFPPAVDEPSAGPRGHDTEQVSGEDRKEESMATQQQIDAILAKMDGIEGSYGGSLVSRDGMIIASRIDKRFAADKIAALTTAAVNTATKVVVEAGLGKPTQMLIEGTDGKMALIHAAKGGFFLSLLGSKEMNVGMARLALQEAIDALDGL